MPSHWSSFRARRSKPRWPHEVVNDLREAEIAQGGTTVVRDQYIILFAMAFETIRQLGREHRTHAFEITVHDWFFQSVEVGQTSGDVPDLGSIVKGGRVSKNP